MLLKLYIYGYLNRVQSSRRLEREAQRNVEVMWLTGHLAPDFKTIADFRGDNGTGIRNACKQFIAICRELNLFSQAVVAIDGSKFKAVNNRDKNFTTHKLEQRIKQIEESIDRYMHALDTADRTQLAETEAKTKNLKEKLVRLRKQMRYLQEMGERLRQAPDEQISLTDPDARSMATSGRGTGMVGYNVQIAVDTEHHLIVAHDVVNVGHDRTQLASMAMQAKAAVDEENVEVLADRGYYKGPEILACVDGLKGFPEAIEAVFPKAVVQLCIVHMVRHSLNYVSWKRRKEVAADLHRIYTAATAEEAELMLGEFEQRWDAEVPAHWPVLAQELEPLDPVL